MIDPLLPTSNGASGAAAVTKAKKNKKKARVC